MWDVNKFPMDYVLDPLYNCQIGKKKKMKRGERYTLLHWVLGLGTSSCLSFKLKKEKEKISYELSFHSKSLVIMP